MQLSKATFPNVIITFSFLSFEISLSKKIEQLFNSSTWGLSPGGTHLRIFVIYAEFNFNPSSIFLEKDWFVHLV